VKEERINEIWAIFLLAISIILFISLLSFNSSDLPLYTSSPNTSVKNFAGIAGAYFAGLLIFSIGKASLIIPFLALSWAIGRFIGKVPEKFYLKILGAAVFIIAASSLLSIINRHDAVIRFSSGGIVGLGFSSLLIKYFGTIGSYIITSALMMLSFLLATEFLLFPFLVTVYNKTKTLVTNTKASIKARLASIEKPKSPLPKKPAKKPELPQRPPRPVIIKKKPEPEKKKSAQEVVPVPEMAKAKEAKEKIEPKEYTLPTLNLLDSPPPIEERRLKEDSETSSKILEETLGDFGLEVKVVKIEQGPVITRYELEPAPGIKISRIACLSDNIALAMKAHSVRIVAPIPGKGTVGVEVPNQESALVYLREILETKDFKDASDAKLTIALGKDISGHPVLADLSDMPHLLIAGATGSGKTVCVNSLVASLLFNTTPEELKFLMVDPKMVELSIYNNIPHLLCPVVTEAKKVSAALNWVVNEMDNRYKLFAETGARNIDVYNRKMAQNGNDKMAYIVVIIDELADLMVVAQQEIENAITRLAQLSRAVGIHIVLATQRPSVDVITGVIKANFPARISFKVASKVDSRTVLDMNGADKLMGRGDMLFIEPGASKPIRAQGSLVSDAEIEKIVDYIKGQRQPEYNIDILKEQKKAKFKTFEKDEVYEEAVKIVLQTKQASVSMLQRRLGLGYTRAARLVDMMEDEGIIGPYAGSKPRTILVEGDYKQSTEAVEEE